MIPLDERKQIWQLLHALDCFQQVQRICDFMLKENIVNGHLLCHSLLTALYVLYGRPFKKSRGIGKLPDEIVPVEFEALHKNLVTHRDKIFAHTDTDGALENEGLALNQVELLVREGFYEWRVRTIQPESERISEIQSLSEQLIRKVDYHVQKFNKKWGRSVPKGNGLYRLALSSEALIAFEPEVDFSDGGKP